MPPLQPDLHLVESFDDARALYNWMWQPRGWLGLDTETGGLDWWRDELRMVQIGDLHTGWAIPFQQWKGLVKELLEGYSGYIALHNAKFDLHYLRHNGITIPQHQVHDTMFMVSVAEPEKSAGLKPAAARLIDPSAQLGQDELKIAMMKGKWTWATVPLDLPEYWIYAALDPVLTAYLAEILYPQVGNSELYKVELASAYSLMEMEARGIKINEAYCQDQSQILAEYETQMREWFYNCYEIDNPGSDAEMIRFFQSNGIPLTKRTSKNKIALDKHVLKGIDHPVAGALLNFREAVKTRSTYFDDFLKYADEFGFIHSTINPLGARTGRMSSERPNVQNIPRKRKVRSAFIPREKDNVFVLADFDQIEFRLMAHYSQQKEMVQAVLDGIDLHTFVGRMIYQVDELTKQQRQIAKNANFAKIYGAGAEKFATTAGIEVEDAQRFIAMYDSRFPDIKRYANELINAARTDGGITAPYLGRRQTVYDKNAAYKIVNYFIQGTAADVLKRKIVELSMTPLNEYMLIPIHDEIAFDVPEDIAEDVARTAVEVMTEDQAFSIPLSVEAEIVSNWGDKYE